MNRTHQFMNLYAPIRTFMNQYEPPPLVLAPWVFGYLGIWVFGSLGICIAQRGNLFRFLNGF
jgi:hypothetical protein